MNCDYVILAKVSGCQ